MKWNNTNSTNPKALKQFFSHLNFIIDYRQTNIQERQDDSTNTWLLHRQDKAVEGGREGEGYSVKLYNN